MRPSSHNSNNLGRGIVISATNSVEIGLIMAVELLFFLKCYIDLRFKGQLICQFCYQPLLHHSGERLAKIGRIIGEI